MMNAPSRFGLSLGFCLAAGAVFADPGDSVSWVNVSDREASWATAANWDPSTDIPTNRENVGLCSQGDDFTIGRQRIHTFATSGTAIGTHPNEVDPYIGSITGDVRHVVSIDNLVMDGSYGQSVYLKPSQAGAYNTAADGVLARFMDVLDPNGFYGLWKPMGVKSRLLLHSSDSFTPTLHDFSSAQRPVISDLGAGRVAVDVVHGGGSFEKYGAGTLSLGAMGGKSTRLYTSGGTVEISAPTEAKIAAIEAKAALHLDASDAASLVKSGSSVTRWNDVRGAGYAYAATPTDYEPIDDTRIATVTSPTLDESTGRPLVSFGTAGSTHAMAIEPASLPNVRAVAYVASEPYQGAAMIFSDLSSDQFRYSASWAKLYDPSLSDVAVREADISFNLTDVTYDNIPYEQRWQLHVVAQNVLRDAAIGLLATCQYRQNLTGGASFGEILIFTNDLTRAERTLLARHLYEKWIEGRPLPDLRDVVEKGSAGMTLSVPAGETARVGQISSSAGFVKEGAGTLSVEQVVPSTAAITIRGGSVAFRPPVVTNTIAGVPTNPYFWIDAENVDAAGIVEEEGVKYVKTWKDTREGSSLVATSAYTESPHMPRLIDSAVCGRKVVSFGKWNNTDSAWDSGNTTAAYMKLPSYSKSAGATYDYFCVLRPTNESVKWNGRMEGGMSRVWAEDYDGMTDSESLIASTYKSLLLGTAKWYVNGESIDPFTYTGLAYAAATNNFIVLSGSMTVPFHPNILCKGYNYWAPKKCGGYEIGEYIIYDHALTPGEHLNVEAYLMKKWLGKTHPAQASLAPTFDYDDDLALAVDTDADMTLGKVSGGNGSIVKSGTGAVTIGSLAVEPTRVTVSGGSVSLPVGGATLLSEARFHLDASRLDTMTYTVDTDGATNVSAWADVRGNGFEARACLDTLATVYPKLVTVDSGRGTQIPALDFGDYSWRTNDYAEVGESATMKFYRNGAFEHAVSLEAFCVFADAPGEHRASFFGSTTGHEFQRDWVTGYP